MSLLFKILAVTGSAMFAGVMLAIGVILGGYWKSLPPADFLDWFAQHSQLVLRAIPIVVIPTLIGLAGVLWSDWSNIANRIIWIGAAGCILAVLALTMAYYVPSNAAFAAKAIPVDQVSGKLDTWLMIHNLRIALAFAASALGVWAISR
ncbi:anthrone oxygenase family protein [Rhizobium leguminosarum]|uniref:anthrone oxygenase family protein n=1 Tax=Rhizobium leguminosarum TaxID=384 RepID=UPI003F94522A